MPIALSFVEQSPYYGLSEVPWQEVSWVAGSFGFLVAACALVVNAFANRANTKVRRATFWLDIRRMFAAHDNVFEHLQEGGLWHKSDTEPSKAKERTQVIPYLSLLEQVKFMLDQGLIDPETIDATLVPYRVRLVLQNGPIKRDLLHKGLNDEKPDFRIFKELVDYFDHRYCHKHNFDYRSMYDSKVGGSPEDALVYHVPSWRTCERENGSADKQEAKPRKARR